MPMNETCPIHAEMTQQELIDLLKDQIAILYDPFLSFTRVNANGERVIRLNDAMQTLQAVLSESCICNLLRRKAS